MNTKPPTPKMTSAQAKLFWKNLTPQQRADFNKMYAKLTNQELQMTYVGVDDNEKIQHVVLEPKDKLSEPIAPYAKYFKE